MSSSGGCYPDKALEIDVLLDTLGHHLRRETVHYFESEATSVGATVEDIVAFCERRGVPRSGREVRIELEHRHLPKLEDRGWLSYDARSGDIRYHGHPDAGEWLAELRGIF